ncbi:MAG: symmetrical bis(5'-nucleosyl)-tetraphosphatase [Proteobacteria bacterium]|nr:symmetrical bis(5'-nucleosyl)-tetraphosphatase [Pseudomonadota bacterium]
MSTYVLGDIQGCFNELERLLNIVDYDASVDRLWFVGDLVNRGTKNLETLEFIMSQDQAVVVLGNHDLHFLGIAAGCHDPVAKDTVSDLLASPRLPEIIDWLRRQPLIHHDRESGMTMVHAGIPPMWDLSTSQERANEVESVLQSEDYRSFLQDMYGNQPDQWQDELVGADRLRIITNYFTRMRFCTASGKLELEHKGRERPAGFSPWFELLRPSGKEMRILFGHWAALGGMTNSDSAIALDTGCVWGRTLTAFRIEDRRFFSTPALGNS